MFKSESLNLIGEAQKTHLVDGREYSSAWNCETAWNSEKGRNLTLCVFVSISEGKQWIKKCPKNILCD
jgi:hypothetical protein